MVWALNKLQRLICHKAQITNQRMCLCISLYICICVCVCGNVFFYREVGRETVSDIRADGVTLSYLPTPSLWQDMTQGQFLSGVYQV